VHWYSPIKDATLTLPDLAETKDGPIRTVDRYLTAKALSGDTSDCIPGLDRYGLATALKLLDEYGSLDSFWAGVDTGSKPRTATYARAATPEARAMYTRNRLLMDWSLAPALDPLAQSVTAFSADKADLRELCSDYGLERTYTALSRIDLSAPAHRQRIAAIDQVLNGEPVAEALD